MNVWKILKGIYEKLSNIDGNLIMSLTPVLGAAGAMLGMLHALHQFINWALDQIDAIIADLNFDFGNADFSSVASDIWVTMNTFFPMDLTFEIIAVFLTLKATAALIRVIKSWIPTVA
ncbi:hypothetical protein [Cerasicoccus fimbriatus]|uniref:hypothetical protein n=1 Tax=Cerasicoccus fimbriatus TaxID=3014554 RepID=UPI0022B4E68A|nr:hypothetical protein [Cerasicoccus sp. TK19100]